MKKISILGCGWLGLSLGEFLVNKGHTVLGSTTRAEKFPSIKGAGISPFLLKLPDEFEEKTIADFFHTDVLILNIPPSRKDSNVVDNHRQQIQKVIEFLEKGTIEKVIFISSTGVYGNENKIVTEEGATNPVRDSGKALVEVEKLLQSQTSFQTTILRMGGLVGGDRKAGRFLAGKKNVKNGNAPVNMVHRDDCIGVIDAILNQNIWNEILNVCADKHPTRKEFYLAQTKKQGLEAPTFTEEDTPQFKIISNKKLKTVLNYSFIHEDPMNF